MTVFKVGFVVGGRERERERDPGGQEEPGKPCQVRELRLLSTQLIVTQ